MKRIEVVITYDDFHDCETCGSSWAVGGYVLVDGTEVVRVDPVAHCYGGTSVTEEELLVLALEKLGVELLADGEKFDITCSDVREDLGL